MVTKRSPKQPLLPRGPSPDIQARKYKKALLRLLSSVRTATANDIIPRIQEIADALGDGRASDILNEAIAQATANYESHWGSKPETDAKQTARALIRDSGVRAKDQLKTIAVVDPFRSEPWLNAEAETFTAENVALIKSIPSEYFTDVRSIVISGVQNGVGVNAIAKQLAHAYGVSLRRAGVIAQDQSHKFSARLDQVRQQRLGIEEYYWRDVNDSRVRPRHKELAAASDKGKKYRWDDPPVVDEKTGRRAHPGGDFLCRCFPDPVLPEFD